MSNITITGVSSVVGSLNRIKANANANIERTLNLILLDLTKKAKDLAPVLTGDLRGHGFKEIKKIGECEFEGRVIFPEEYALEQHENLTFHHPLGGQAKYLETPYLANKDKYKKKMDEAIQRSLHK